MSRQLVIDAKWDPMARVWVSTSEDVQGVAVEADTANETMEVLQDVVVDLMEASGIAANGDMDVVVRFARREEPLSLKAA